MSALEQIGLLLAGVILLSIAVAFGVQMVERRAAKAKKSGPPKPVDPTLKSLDAWSKKLGITFDPKDPKDPLAALIASGEYFRMPGCAPGGPYYEETFRRVLHMIEDMVPPDRLNFWVDQVYRLYGSKELKK